MTLFQVFLILNARRRIILVTLVTTVLATLGVNLLMPKSYKATTTLVMNYKGIDSVTGMAVPAQLMPGYMATQVDILNSKNVALKVVNDLQLSQDKLARKEYAASMNGRGTIENWLAERLLKKLEATPSRESSVLDVSFTGRNPDDAAAVANAFARAYQQTSIQLKDEPLRKASSYFNDQAKILKASLDKAQKNLSRYQQEHDIVSVDNRLDLESSRLNDLSAQLVVVQGQRMDASSRQRQAQLSDGTASPDVMANPMIQSLESSVAQADANLSEVSERLGVNHPQYLSAKAEADKRKAQLNAQRQAAAGAVTGTARILQQRESEVRAALQAQKDKVLQLNQARDDLAALTREVDGAQRAYDASRQRFNQTSLEGQSNQTDVAILTEAVPATQPSNPKVWLNTLAAVFFGLLLGVSLSIAAELLDRRLRSAYDFADALDAPLLATLSWSSQAKQGLLARALAPQISSQIH